MTTFKIIAWVYTVNFENQYNPTCKKYEFELKARNEQAAKYKAAYKFNFFGVQKLITYPVS